MNNTVVQNTVMSTSSPTLFRTEAITKLGESVNDIESDITALETSISSVRSIAEQALEIAQNASSSSSDEVYEAADEVQEADEEVVENLLNYDQYDFSRYTNNDTTTYFTVNSCKARKYKDGTMRFFLTITTKSFPALGLNTTPDVSSITLSDPEEVIINSTNLSTTRGALYLKVMTGYNWVYITRNGLVCNLKSFSACGPNEQYTIACEISAADASKVIIGDNVPKETIEASMPSGTTAYDYTYDITTEVNALQSKTQTNITFNSIRMTIRNYDKYYVHFSYSGTFGTDRNANTSATALTSDYITATAELYPSPASSTGDTNFLPSIYPTIGLVFINENAVSERDTFSGATTIICPLSATMTINTSNLKQLESNGGKIKTSTAASVQSSSVRYKFYELGNSNSGDWFGSVNFVQDQLGVFVILSVGHTNSGRLASTTLENIIDNIPVPISLNTTLEVYKLLKGGAGYYEIGNSDGGGFSFRLVSGDNGLRLQLHANASFSAHGFCIHGLIPGAYLHTEDTITTSYEEEETTTI